MELPDSLNTVAEASIGLAGFSGLVVALRRSGGPLDEIQKYRLRVLFFLTFGALFISFVPAELVELGVSEARVWRASSGIFFACSLAFTYWWIVPSRRIARVAPEIFNWKAFNTMLVGHIIVVVLQGLVVAGYLDDRGAGIFLLGLVWYLIHGAQQFVRMLFIQPLNRETAETPKQAS